MTDTHANIELELLSAFVSLVRNWSSVNARGHVARTAGVNIPDSEIRVIYLLGARTREVRPSDIANQLGVSRPSLSKSLALLRDEGLVTGKTTECDRRAVSVTLTDAGKEAYRRLLNAGLALVERAKGDFTTEELLTVARFMRTFLSNLDGPAAIMLPEQAR